MKGRKPEYLKKNPDGQNNEPASHHQEQCVYCTPGGGVAVTSVLPDYLILYFIARVWHKANLV